LSQNNESVELTKQMEKYMEEQKTLCDRIKEENKLVEEKLEVKSK
jgi:hypothetical protein